ncbi:replication initiator [Nonomuraea sp. LPB2021202275-12-8]|uniref:replication initiator n=1 Tax=Nonomuraea sp. LPB2021202275-12-8 TaxID=3120159 RepID=UPI00300C51F7
MVDDVAGVAELGVLTASAAEWSVAVRRAEVIGRLAREPQVRIAEADEAATELGRVGSASWCPASPARDRPDLEIRVLASDDTVAHTLDLVDVQTSRGVDGPGVWLSGTDRSGVLEFRFLMNGPDRDRVRMTLSSLVGKTSADVLPPMQLVADLPVTPELVLAVRGGRPLTSLWRPEESEVRASPLPDMARWTVTFLQALLAVQAHTFHRVTVPDLDEVTPEQVGEVIQLAALLRGEEVRTTWTEITMTRGASGGPPPTDPEFSVLVASQVQVDLTGRQIGLDDVQRRVLYHHARPADPHALASAQPGDSIRLVPGSSAEATIAVAPVGDLAPDDQTQREHAGRMVDALRFEPCSPGCPNWLRYGVQPKGAKPGMTPGRCHGKAHKPDHLGYAGRRVLVSRKWSNKTLAEHKQDRRTWVLEALGQRDQPTDPHRYIWKPVPAGDANLAPLAVRLLRSVHERQRWRAHLDRLQAQADGQDLSATQPGRAA